MNDKFLDDLDRLTKAVESGEVIALLGLADELNERDHPYSEELSLIALLAIKTESTAVILSSMITFFHFQNLTKSESNDLVVLSGLQNLVELEALEKINQ